MMTIRAGWMAFAVVALLVGSAQAQDSQKGGKKAAQPAPQAGIQVPQPELLLVLIRSALIALDHANRTGNYSVLREIGGAALQRHSSGQLSDAFASLRANNVNLLPSAILTPQLLQQPSVSPEGLLQLVGYLPTQPRRTEFHIVYQAAGGGWQLAGLNVALGQPAAPEAKADPKAAPAPKPKAPAARK